MTLSSTTVVWRGLTLSSDRSSPFGVGSLRGWDERPDTRSDSTPRPRAHGFFDSPSLSDERVITLAGQILSEDRDALLWELDAAMALSEPDAPPEELVVTRAGRTLMAWARLSAFKTPTDADWAVGKVPFVAQWRCADSLRYGDPTSATTGFPVPRGGLKFDLYTDGAGTVLGWLDYGEPSLSGRVTLSNPGTADVPVLYQVTGPIPPEGFEIVEVGTGRTVRFEGPVAAGSVLVLSGADGTAVIDGVADRGGQVTRRDWPTVRRGSSVEVAFIPLGESTSAQLTAVVQPGWW